MAKAYQAGGGGGSGYSAINTSTPVAMLVWSWRRRGGYTTKTVGVPTLLPTDTPTLITLKAAMF